MKLNIKLLLGIIYLLLLSINSSAQDQITYDNQQIAALKFVYLPFENAESLPNYFIDQLAESESKIRSYYTFQVAVSTDCKLIKKPQNTYQILIAIDSFTVDKDLMYKGFDFTKIVLPNIIEFSYDLIEVNQNRKENKRIPIPKIAQLILFDSTFVDSTAKSSFQLGDEKLTYYYNAQQKSEFQSAIEMIKIYYQEGEALKQMNVDMSGLKDKSLDKIKLQSIDIKYLRKEFSKLTMPKLAKALSLNTTDPAGIYRYYLETDKTINLLSTQYQIKINQLDTLFYEQGVQFLKDSLQKKAINSFEKALEINSKMVEAIYQLARMNFQQGHLILAKEQLNNLLEISSNYLKGNELSNQVYRNIIEKAALLNQKETYTEALNLLQEAQEFYEKNNTIITFNEDQTIEINKSKYGIYKSYISITGAALRSGRLDMVENYLNTANSYQLKNTDAIPNNNELTALYTLLTTEYLRKSIESKNAFNSQASIRYWNKADSLSKAHQLTDAMSFVSEVERNTPDVNQPKTIAPKLSETKKVEPRVVNPPKVKKTIPVNNENAISNYKTLIEKGEIYLNYRRYELAYPEFVAAKNIENQFNLKKNDSLASYLKLSGKPIIKTKLDNAILLAWKGKYTMAEAVLENTTKEVQDIGLENDPEIINLTNQLTKSIAKKADKELIVKFNDLMQKAGKSVEFKDYISAEEYCNQALHIMKQNPQIELSTDYPTAILSKYEAYIAYQKTLNTGLNYCITKEYDLAIQSFIKADSLYDKRQINASTLQKTSFIKFVQNGQSAGFYPVAIQFLLKENQQNQAFELWKTAIDQNIEIISTVEIECMTALGIFDQSQNPTEDKKLLFGRRFGANRHFASLKKYYYKAF